MLFFFQPSFVICTFPSPLLSGSTPPPLPCVRYTVLYTRTQCVGRVVWGSGPQTDKHLPSLFRGKLFWMTTLCIAFSFLSTRHPCPLPVNKHRQDVIPPFPVFTGRYHFALLAEGGVRSNAAWEKFTLSVCASFKLFFPHCQKSKASLLSNITNMRRELGGGGVYYKRK
jgi:hypothetical protein